MYNSVQHNLWRGKGRRRKGEERRRKGEEEKGRGGGN